MTDAPIESTASFNAIEAELDGVARALDRLEAGEYERCEVCGEAIGPERLAADPIARRCDAHVGP